MRRISTSGITKFDSRQRDLPCSCRWMTGCRSGSPSCGGPRISLWASTTIDSSGRAARPGGCGAAPTAGRKPARGLCARPFRSRLLPAAVHAELVHGHAVRRARSWTFRTDRVALVRTPMPGSGFAIPLLRLESGPVASQAGHPECADGESPMAPQAAARARGPRRQLRRRPGPSPRPPRRARGDGHGAPGFRDSVRFDSADDSQPRRAGAGSDDLLQHGRSRELDPPGARLDLHRPPPDRARRGSSTLDGRTIPGTEVLTVSGLPTRSPRWPSCSAMPAGARRCSPPTRCCTPRRG